MYNRVLSYGQWKYNPLEKSMVAEIIEEKKRENDKALNENVI